MSPRRWCFAILPLVLATWLPTAVGAQPPVYILQWGTSGSGNGQFNDPNSVATDGAGDVYVVDRNNHRVQKFTSTGAYVTQWGSPSGSGNGQLLAPNNVATDAAGNVYVTENGNYRVQKFTGTGTYVTQWGSNGTGNGQFSQPWGIATDAAGNVYVSDLIGNRIQKFTSTGVYLTQWGSAGSGNGQFQFPAGVATDPAGNVYVVDNSNERIQKFTSTGTYLTQWGTSGSGNGQFNSANGVATDSDGNVYVADQGNNRIQKFTGTGTYLAQWGTSGSGNGQFGFPRAVATDLAGRIYVVDPGNQRIQKFGPTVTDVIAADGAGLCISTATPCVTVPIKWDRADATPVRGYSVTLQLSGNLTLCGAQFASAGYLLGGPGGTTMLVTPLGGGQYTIDEVTLGSPCGATGSATLFNVSVTSASPTGTGTISVLSVAARDCSNNPVPASAGAPAAITIDQVGPVAVSNLGSTQIKTGNDADGTTLVQVNFAAPGDATVTEVYRHGFGGYPQYDENGGAVPTAPASYPPAGWTLTPVTASGQSDNPPSRDFWYYVVYTKDGCGNVSSVSNLSGGTLNYHLGDVHNGVASCSGNNLVNTSDVSFLGANYGIVIPVNGALECLDVGPTTNGSVNARPTTDNRTNFEDLILAAINFGLVSAPQMRALPVATRANALRLQVPDAPAVGESFAVDLELSGAGDIQGLSAWLDFDGRVVEFLGAEAGPLLGAQGAQGVVLSSAPGNVDVALLGTGTGMRGAGVVARARFRVRAAGEPGITLRAADARDAANGTLSLDAAAPATTIRPAATALAMPRPSPFRDATVIECALARPGDMSLVVFGIDGRRVRTLASGAREPGVYRFSWDGRDDAGREAAAGVYYVRMMSAEGRFNRTLVRLR